MNHAIIVRLIQAAKFMHCPPPIAARIPWNARVALGRVCLSDDEVEWVLAEAFPAGLPENADADTFIAAANASRQPGDVDVATFVYGVAR